MFSFRRGVVHEHRGERTLHLAHTCCLCGGSEHAMVAVAGAELVGGGVHLTSFDFVVVVVAPQRLTSVGALRGRHTTTTY
eukprot:3811759-Prymnesium_polylepis.1